MNLFNILLPFAPLAFYLLSFFMSMKALCTKIPETRRHPIFDLEMNGSLTLAGFSITIFGVLVSLAKPETPPVAIYHISLSISFFLLSYALYYLRMREGFILFGAGFRNAGIWTLISGMVYLASQFPYAVYVLVGCLIIFTLYIVLDIFLLSK